jgi:hypothetical protein
MLSTPPLGDGLLVRVMQGVRATQKIMDALATASSIMVSYLLSMVLP